ncbi:hypothetical protein [Companilactobacillus ginsenosidimutans]|uniref:hypothetical protein n=1 Tax=Companilactobacillus ginsenosidimutans TaxID=1007676 RepID=UPI000660445C|nr:hypothetical protein [Companilactobacillus ginsenosidimutans]
MDYIMGMNLINSAELVIMAVIVYAITQALKQTKIKNAYMPFIAMAVGIFSGLIIGLIFHEQELGKACLAGFLVGASTAGLFTGIKGIAGGYSTEWKPTKEQKNLDMKG